MNDSPPAWTDVLHAAEQSALAHYAWHQRGRAPLGYIKGMALAYAQAVGKYRQGDRFALEMAQGAGAPAHDALAAYRAQFAALGLNCDAPGELTLRHLFTLLTGLGMRESSGRACEGRDRSADNTTADTAEAGLFQASFNLRHAHPLLPELFQQFKGSSELLDVFMQGVMPKPGDLEDFGAGEGREFQHLTKQCPAFAVAFAAIGLRHQPGHWGPINRKEAELRPEAEDLFKQVETLV